MRDVKYDKIMETDKWAQEIPYIKFPMDWKIQITPPFAGATVRFRVMKGNAWASIYLDCYNNLGCEDEPYWEVYPIGGDVQRCALKDIERLLELISISIDEQYISEESI